MYTNTHLLKHASTHTHTHTHTPAPPPPTHTHTHKHTVTPTHTHTHTHTQSHTYTQKYTHTLTHTHIRYSLPVVLSYCKSFHYVSLFTSLCVLIVACSNSFTHYRINTNSSHHTLRWAKLCVHNIQL